MTVQYSLTAATASFKKFAKLLLRWKGSIWKLVYVEIGCWMLCCFFWLAAYILGCKNSDRFKEPADKLLNDVFKTYNFNTTVTLLIGFTSSLVLSRWLDIYRLLVWPDNLCQMFNSYFMDSAIPPKQARLLRQNIARWLTLSYVLILKDISVRIRDKFKNDDHLIAKKLTTEKELEDLYGSGLNQGMCHYWVPLTWIISHLKKHYQPGVRNVTLSGDPSSVMSEQHYMAFVTEVIRVRGLLGDLLSFDWVPVPLAIFQLNVICCYVALIHNVFAVSIPLADDTPWYHRGIGMGVTLFATCARMTLYVGWLKCMGVVLNPFGRDDDDFELCFYLERHAKIIKALIETPIEPLVNNENHRLENHLTHTLFSAINAVTAMPEKHVTVQSSLRRRANKNKRSPSLDDGLKI